MKALKSDIAKRVLADPQASGKLREFWSRGAGTDRMAVSRETIVIELRDASGSVRRLRPRVVATAG